MRSLLFLSAFISSLFLIDAVHSQEKKQSEITYTIVPDYQDNQQLNVSFIYKTDKKGNLILRYENESWGDTALFRCIKSLSVEPKARIIHFLPDSSQIVINAKPNQQLTVRYTIQQDFDDSVKNYHRYRPIIQNTYFHILGMRLFIYPVQIFPNDEKKAHLHIKYINQYDAELFHSSLGESTEMEAHLTREELYGTFFLGGDFRRREFKTDGKSVFFITRGKWLNISEDSIFNMLEKTVKAQLAFWNESFAYDFSVSLLPTYEEWTETSKSYSVGGSGLTNSFISFASNNPGIEMERVSWLYNHEFLHRWIGQKIKNKSEEKQYWFSEGFTEYYAYKLMNKNGLLTSSELKKLVISEFIIPHQLSPVNSITNNEITYDKFWSDRNYQKLPYRRGFLYALLLDYKINEQYNSTKSLDNLMLDLLNEAEKNGSFRLDTSTFAEVLLEYLDASALNDFNEFIEQGSPIDFPKALPQYFSKENDEITLNRLPGEGL
ncbi:hypothetical protein GCM10011506_15100 [Marivirga lumbricoides]|uniref:Peptidase M61 catalytic domain-containing protein n=1 Tax=Marivirga lumbricoides TaxID=1046115 RepID=A0ABQ1LVH5_9BACT|nr:hypothetical protein GCM10011506_15100 [Marivirga lumbricoides]